MMNAWNKSKQWVDRISEILLTVTAIICLLLPVIVLIIVIVRAVYPGGIPDWSIDICQLLMWFLAYLGAGLVFRLGRHVRVSVLIDQIQGVWRWTIDFTILVISLVASSLMMAGGLRSCLASWLDLRKTTSEGPEYIFAIAIPIGLGFLVYEVTVCVVQQAKRTFSRKA
jgi:TRAP-type C4-dicarboxylate transport system permease small subunit